LSVGYSFPPIERLLLINPLSSPCPDSVEFLHTPSALDMAERLVLGLSLVSSVDPVLGWGPYVAIPTVIPYVYSPRYSSLWRVWVFRCHSAITVGCSQCYPSL